MRFNRFFLIVSLVLVTQFCNAQITGSSPPYESWSQMFDITNTYRGATVLNSGNLRDTSGPGTKRLYSSKAITARIANTDSFVVNPIAGNAPITFTQFVRKAQWTATTVNPVVVCTLMKSVDGSNFTPVVGATVFTLTPTSATTPSSCSWDLSRKDGRFFMTQNVVTVDTASIQTGWYSCQPIQYSISK